MNCSFDEAEHNQIVYNLINKLSKGIDVEQLSGNGALVEYKMIQPTIMYNDKYGRPYPEYMPYVQTPGYTDIITSYPDKVKVNGSYIHCEPPVAEELFNFLFNIWCEVTEKKLDSKVYEFNNHLF